MAGVSEPVPVEQSGHKSFLVFPQQIRDGSLFRENAAALSLQREVTPETRAAIEQYNRILEAIANRELDRTDALRQIAALEIFTSVSAPQDDLGLLIHDPPYQHQARSTHLSLVEGRSLEGRRLAAVEAEARTN